MRPRYNLRFRVALAFAVSGAIVCLLMGGFQLWATHDLSQRLIDETLSAELDDYFSRRERNPHSLPPKTVILHGYVRTKGASVTDMPNYLDSLPPGRHDLTVGRLTYRVAVVDHLGERYFFLYDTTLQQKREQRSILFILGSIVIVGLIAALGGVWLVGVIIAPVTELANRIRNRRTDVWVLELADDFSHDEVGELARAFDAHLGTIHLFAERERAFTADLSHELRTSLSVILNAAEILLADESLSEKQRRRVERIDRAARDMGEMGNALLLMSREQNLPDSAEKIGVAEIIEEAVAKHRFLLGGKPIELSFVTDSSVQVYADRGLVFILVANLIRNAFTYTESGTVEIIHKGLSLTIRDSGCGMDPRQGRSPFYPSWQTVSRTKGAGIGLTLVRRICERYGWTLRIASGRDQGTTVKLFFGLTDH
ncbi:MAG: HAMP domain-containing histidine kinase [Magnetococcales bacterium]|nr:HAMP domain-containing histidine kinase [Magnetococcales bacterium]